MYHFEVAQDTITAAQIRDTPRVVDMSKGNANNIISSSSSSSTSNIKFPGHSLNQTSHNSHISGGGGGGGGLADAPSQSSYPSAAQQSVGGGGAGGKGILPGNHPHNRLQSSQQATTKQQQHQPQSQSIVNGISSNIGQHPQQKPALPKPQQQQFHLNQYQLESQQRHQQQQKLLDKNLLSTGLPPPRYQPPPQPQQQVSGILKNIVGQQQQPPSEDSDLKLKPPPEVDIELSNLYLTGSKSLSNISSRIVPPKKQLRGSAGSGSDGGIRGDIEVQIHPPPRIPASSSSLSLQSKTSSHPSQKAVEDELNYLQRQQQLHQHQQQQEMLKFVRKSDSGQPSPSSSGGGSASGRLPADQNRHLQVKGGHV